jgi:hypothetical protein
VAEQEARTFSLSNGDHPEPAAVMVRPPALHLHQQQRLGKIDTLEYQKKSRSVRSAEFTRLRAGLVECGLTGPTLSA